MPAKEQENMKGTSPSPNIQRGNDQAWGAQEGFKSPDQAIANQWNKKPVPPTPAGGEK